MSDYFEYLYGRIRPDRFIFRPEILTLKLSQPTTFPMDMAVKLNYNDVILGPDFQDEVARGNRVFYYEPDDVYLTYSRVDNLSFNLVSNKTVTLSGTIELYV